MDPQQPRSSYHHGDLRRALLAAARRLIQRSGAGRVSLRAIAREAGVSHAAPYHHFADRDALLAALAATGFDALREAMERRSEGALDQPFRSLQEAGVAYVRFAMENPELYRLMFSGPLTDRARYPELQRAADDAFGVLQRLLGSAGGTRAAKASRAVPLTAWSTVHGLAMLLIDGRLEEETAASDSDEIAREVTRVLGRGLRSVADPE